MDPLTKWILISVGLVEIAFIVYFGIRLFREVRILLKELKIFRNGVEGLVRATMPLAQNLDSLSAHIQMRQLEIQDLVQTGKETAAETALLARSIIAIDATPVRQAVAYGKFKLQQRTETGGKFSKERAKALVTKTTAKLQRFYDRVQKKITRARARKRKSVYTRPQVLLGFLGGAAFTVSLLLIRSGRHDRAGE